MVKINVKATFSEELLGTSPNTEDLYVQFVGSKAPDAATLADEVAAAGASAVTEKSKTVFNRDGDGPFLYDYQIKGYFKDACSMLARVGKTEKTKNNESGKLTAYKKTIDGLIFVSPRKIHIHLPRPEGTCQRPLRASTAQGERIALAISETAPEGSSIEFCVTCLEDSHAAAVREWLDYGEMRGIGQWRNSGKGRFKWEEAGSEKACPEKKGGGYETDT